MLPPMTLVEQQRGDVPKRKSRKQPRPRDELRQLITDAASELFAREGYHVPTIRQIASAAHVDLPVLYRLFDDKRDIYVQCCKLAARKQIAIARSFYRQTDALDITLYKLILAGITFKIDNSIDYRLLHRIVMDGDRDVIREESEEYQASDMFRRVLQASTDACSGNLPIIRLMLIDSIFNLMPDILDRWPSSPETDATDPALLTQRILSVVYPEIDWSEVADRSAVPAYSTYCGNTPQPAGDGVGAPPSNARSPA